MTAGCWTIRNAILVAVGCLMATGCGGSAEKSASLAADEPRDVAPAGVALQLERRNGTRATVSGTPLVYCGESENIDGTTLNVMLRLGRELERQPTLMAEVAKPDLVEGREITFPDEWVYDEPARGGTLFVTDPRPAEKGEDAEGDVLVDELSSDTEGSDGSMTVRETEGCDVGDAILLDVDAKLGSEEGDQVVAVRGTVSGTVEPEPDWDELEAEFGDADE